MFLNYIKNYHFSTIEGIAASSFLRRSLKADRISNKDIQKIYETIETAKVLNSVEEVLGSICRGRNKNFKLEDLVVSVLDFTATLNRAITSAMNSKYDFVKDSAINLLNKINVGQISEDRQIALGEHLNFSEGTKNWDAIIFGFSIGTSIVLLDKNEQITTPPLVKAKVYQFIKKGIIVKSNTI